MGPAVYILGTLTSLCCATLLLRGYSRVKKKLLLWSGLCFVGPHDFEPSGFRGPGAVSGRQPLSLEACHRRCCDDPSALRLDLGERVKT